MITLLAVFLFGYLIIDGRTVKQADSPGLNVITPEGSTINLNIKEKPAYFFSPG